MTLPVLGTVDFGGPRDAPLIVCGPSLGTSVSALWTTTASQLTHGYRVIGYDLPGHGRSPAPTSTFTIADIAAAVHHLATAHGSDRYHYSGVSAGGAVGLELLLQHGDSLASTALICTGAKIRTTESWLERATSVRDKGTAIMREPALNTWFAHGFTDRDPGTAAALLGSLQDTDAAGYAAICEALAHFDVRDRLADVEGNVTVICGRDDIATPPDTMRALAQHIPGARYVEFPKTAHLAPAEQPDLTAKELLASMQRSPL
jgi:3-oxoadipate enol-lactonase / 4-carboxymuconolactone decarboxylase